MVTGVSLDSRAVRPGDLYAALPGYHVHGGRFAADAVRLGAVAVITDDAGAAAIEEHGAPNVPVLVSDSPREASVASPRRSTATLLETSR